MLEGLHGVLLVGGDEHDLRAPRDRARRLDAVQAGHVHVEEDDLRQVGVEELDRLAAVARLGDHLQLGPQARQLAAQALAQQRFVVGDQCRRAGHGVASPRSREHQLGAQAVRRHLVQVEPRVGAVEGRQARAQVGQAGARRGRLGQADAGVGDPQR